MKPLKNIHLQQSIHISSISVGSTSIKTESLRSLRELGPKADNESDIDVRAAAAMCQYAYYALNNGQKPKAELIDGWKPMKSYEVDKLVEPNFHLKLKRDASGFNSMLFQKYADGIQYYAYCTEGTDMTSVKDWFSNISQGLIGLSPQYSYSVQMAMDLDRAIGDKAVLWFIGHSLGGGLASNNSLVTSRHAITFNAAGLNSLRVGATLLLNNQAELFHFDRRRKRIHAFVLEGEILNSILRWIGQEAYGTKHVITYQYKQGEKMKSSVEKHGLTTILDSWGMKHD